MNVPSLATSVTRALLVSAMCIAPAASALDGETCDGCTLTSEAPQLTIDNQPPPGVTIVVSGSFTSLMSGVCWIQEETCTERTPCYINWSFSVTSTGSTGLVHNNAYTGFARAYAGTGSESAPVTDPYSWVNSPPSPLEVMCGETGSVTISVKTAALPPFTYKEMYAEATCESCEN